MSNVRFFVFVSAFMPVTESPLPAAFRIGGKVVLGFHVYEYHGLEDFGRAELILGPPGSSAHFGVQRTLKDFVSLATHSPSMEGS